jgi:HK97 family phage portal protein
MAENNRYIPSSLNANDKPSWPVTRFFKSIFGGRIEPETYSQSQGITITKYGVIRSVKNKSGKAQFGEFSDYNPMAIWRPGGSATIDPVRAMANDKGYVYAATNAIAREVMNIDWRLFEVDGKDHKEHTEHIALDLLDGVNDSMTGPELKYLTSKHLDLVGNAYWYLEGVSDETTKPTAIYLLDASKTHPVIDTTTFPFQVVGYEMKMDTRTFKFKPYEILHFRLPDPTNPFEGRGVVQAGAEYIDNDNYAMEFNRKFFINGARPAGFLESEMVSETQIETLKIGFANMHEGVDNMQRIAVLPKGVKWSSVGSSPKDMDFRNLSIDMRDRILALFGVSKTILGTAESDTNRSTAETADYVFAKRVIKPRMTLICSFLNEKLIPRYGENFYISFIDPVPEDKAFRTTEMQTAVGSQPVLTVNEAREEFMGLGPVEGGDALMRPTAMQPADEPTADPQAGPKKPPTETNDDNKDTEDEEESSGKSFANVKAANGQRVAFHPVRVKLQTRAKQRKAMGNDLANKIVKALEEAAKKKKFESSKEQDEAVWKEFSSAVSEAEKQITAALKQVNNEQKKEVLANLPHVLKKAIDPSKLFDLDSWISITVDALTPAITSLYESEGKVAATEIGKPSLNPLSDVAARVALHESIGKMARSYEETTLATLESKINDGLSSGASLADISSTVQEIYEWRDTTGADRVAKTESFRTANASLKEVWKQSGVVKTVRWYTANNPCPFCSDMNGKTISVDSNFLNAGDTMTVGEQSLTMDYDDVSAPPLHPNCMCFVRPDEVSLA